MEDFGFLHNGFLVDGSCHILDGQMCGDQCHPQVLVEQYHQCLLVLSYPLLNIFGMSAEVESFALDIVLVDRSSHQHVITIVLVVFHGALQGFEGGQSCLFRWFAHVHLHILIKGGQKVELSVLGLFGTVDDGEVALNVEGIAVVGRNLGRPIDNRRTQFEHSRLGKSLEYHFVTYAVCISVCDGHTWFCIFHFLYLLFVGFTIFKYIR